MYSYPEQTLFLVAWHDTIQGHNDIPKKLIPSDVHSSLSGDRQTILPAYLNEDCAMWLLRHCERHRQKEDWTKRRERHKKKRCRETNNRDCHSGQIPTTSPSGSLPLTCAPLILNYKQCVSLTQFECVWCCLAKIYCPQEKHIQTMSLRLNQNISHLCSTTKTSCFYARIRGMSASNTVHIP